MSESKFSVKFLIGLLVALFFGIALFLRVYFPYDKVFSGDWIKFTGNDPYYHMRLVDNLVYNFPHFFKFDPYFIYPDGIQVGSTPFFDWLLASIIWVVGLGSPTERTVDVVGVYFPAVLGALTVIPVYFIGKELFGRRAGLLASGLVAILPGEFLGRSILGFTDHHVAEALFTAVAMMFLILAVKVAREKQLTFSHLKRRGWATSARALIYSLLAGIFLGIYIFTFLGALLFVFIIFVYFVIQFLIDHLKQKSTDYLCLVGVTFFLLVLIISWLFSLGMLYLASLFIALITLAALSGLSRLMVSKRLKPVYYLLAVAGVGLVGLGVFRLVSPSLFSSMLGSFINLLRPSGATLTTIEAQPILFPSGQFSIAVVWGNFTTAIFFSLFSLGLLIYLVIKQGSPEKSLLIVWSLVILAATLGQRRFAYYFTVNVALLTGYFSVLSYYGFRLAVDYLRGGRIGYVSWRLLELPGLAELATQTAPLPTRAGRRQARRLERQEARVAQRRESGFSFTAVQTSISLWLVIVLLGVFFPNIRPAIATASQARFTPSDGWVSSLFWLRENTPEPFGRDLYYQLEGSYDYRSGYWLERNIPNPSGDPGFYSKLEAKYKYPESAYGVLSWWDYGYWITRIAHRIPNANPSQATKAVTSVADFFTAQDEKSAVEISRGLGSSYIIVDFDTAATLFANGVIRGKFYAIATWAEKKPEGFFEVYLLPPQEGRTMPVLLFYPEYYRSLSSRLYNFDGKAVTPASTVVISYQEMTDLEGRPYKEITSAQQFDSYEEAEAYLSSQNSANYRIVGNNPFVSPVPLEALAHYRLLHASESSVRLSDNLSVPEVKIFEYIK